MLRPQGSLPAMQGPQSMSGQIHAAAIERQVAPTSAKGRPAAVAVLQVQQPAHGRGRTDYRGKVSHAGRNDGFLGDRACVNWERLCRASKAPGVSSASGTLPVRVRPAPAARVGSGVGMAFQHLLLEIHREKPLPLVQVAQVAACARALTLRVVTQIERLVSMGQLPSGRTPADQERQAPSPRPDGRPVPLLTSPSATKLVSGAASRKPPLAGWICSQHAQGCVGWPSRRTQRKGANVGGRW